MRYNTCEMLETAYFFLFSFFFNSLQLLGFFMSVLHAFCRHSNIILIHFYWFLLLKSVLRFPALLSRALRKPVTSILSKYNRLVATWCKIWVWGISEQKTNSFISFLFFFCLLVLCFYMAPSHLFFQYVSCKLFRWNLLNLIGFLTCI